MRDIAVMRTPPQPEAPRSLLVYGVVQDATGRWHVIRHGFAPQPLDQASPPRELVGRGLRAERGAPPRCSGAG